MALKAAAKTTAPPPTAGTVNFGEDGLYAGGSRLPEGDYALEFGIQMHQATDNTTGAPRGQERLGVMVTAHPLDGGDARQVFYSMGSNAHKSFAPDPNTGKSLTVVPGAAGLTLNDSTNWAMLRKSLYDCGLPQGIFTNDVSVLDGIHVHMTPVPEPEERKGFGNAAKTGEVVTEEPRRNGTVAIVTEIKEDGKPWEGKGGLPKAGAKPAPAKTTTGPKSIPAAAPVAAEVDTEAIKIAALNGIASLLSQPANANGMLRLRLRAGTFSAIKASDGEDMAQAVTDTFFVDDNSLSPLLNELGYELKGAQVQPRP